mmetsp:Transcript_56292/g.132670  ORF Transcript_56292/g.132670 Transcript_56292/m.132670 type:complete len:221 (-) Transcript_56292:517-1179(-)
MRPKHLSKCVSSKHGHWFAASDGSIFNPNGARLWPSSSSLGMTRPGGCACVSTGPGETHASLSSTSADRDPLDTGLWACVSLSLIFVSLSSLVLDLPSVVVPLLRSSELLLFAAATMAPKRLCPTRLPPRGRGGRLPRWREMLWVGWLAPARFSEADCTSLEIEEDRRAPRSGRGVTEAVVACSVGVGWPGLVHASRLPVDDEVLRSSVRAAKTSSSSTR